MPIYNLNTVVNNPQGHAMKDGAPIIVEKSDGTKEERPAPDLKIGALCFVAMQAVLEEDSKLTITDKRNYFNLMMRLSKETEISLSTEEVKIIKDRLWNCLHYSSAGLGELAIDEAEITKSDQTVSGVENN